MVKGLEGSFSKSMLGYETPEADSAGEPGVSSELGVRKGAAAAARSASPAKSPPQAHTSTKPASPAKSPLKRPAAAEDKGPLKRPASAQDRAEAKRLQKEADRVKQEAEKKKEEEAKQAETKKKEEAHNHVLGKHGQPPGCFGQARATAQILFFHKKRLSKAAHSRHLMA